MRTAIVDHGRLRGMLGRVTAASILGTAAAVMLLGAGLLLTGCGDSEAGGSAEPGLTIYVPCGMELPFAAAEDAFEKAHPGVEVNVVLDNANVLVRRILEKGEKADLIALPGTLEMERMQKEGAVKADAVVAFGQYDLALFVPRKNPAGVTRIADLAKPEVEVVAIPDPDHNSVGYYIREALTALDLWSAVEPKLLLTDHPITAYKHVAGERASASFAYRSCPLKTAPDKLEYSSIRVIESVPGDLYGPALALIAPLSESPRQDLASEFITLLTSPEGQAMLREYDVPALKIQTASAP